MAADTLHAPNNQWICVARLPESTSFTLAPWEQRHHDELAIRQGHHPSTFAWKHGFNEAREPSFNIASIRESDLVSRCLFALQGEPVAISEIQILANYYSHQISDRSLHRLATLWQRSSTTKAIGKLLSVMAQAGRVRLQLEEFVDFFLKPHRQGVDLDYFCKEQPAKANKKAKKREKQKSKNSNRTEVKDEALNLSPPYSLVNQAFAKAVKTILQGHLASLNTLTASVFQRRSTDSSSASGVSFSDDNDGVVIAPSSCELTLLELHLHTATLRIQLQALASVCLYDGSTEASGEGVWEAHGNWLLESVVDISLGRTISNFSKFPKGADLLTFLYKRLQDADSVHIELLQYLFSSACQPYLAFIQSWLYCATVKDPYKEFIVNEKNAHSQSDFKLECSVSVPCFLDEVCTPLLRAGQQLQVLLKLAGTGAAEIDQKYAKSTVAHFSMLDGVLKCWTEFASEKSIFSPVLVFSKERLEELIEERRRKRYELMLNFDRLFSNIHSHAQESNISQQMKNLKIDDVNDEKVSHEIISSMDVEDSFPAATVVPTDDEDITDPQLLSEAIPSNIFVNESLDETNLEKSADQSDEHCSPTRQRRKWKQPTNEDISQNILINEKNFAESAERSDEFGSPTKQRKKWTQTTDEAVLPNLSINEGLDKTKSEESADQPDEIGSPTEQSKKWTQTMDEAVLANLSTNEGLDQTKTEESADQSDECGSPTKQRRKWTQTNDVVIVHGHSEGDANVVDCNTNTSYTYTNDNEAERFNSIDVNGQAYQNSSSLSECSWLDFIYRDKNVDFDKQLRDSQGRQKNFSFSFFFSDACFENMLPEKYFGRSYIHKLAQRYCNYTVSQVNACGKSVPNFDTVSKELWNFESCVNNGGTSFNILPVFASSKVFSVTEKPDLWCRNNKTLFLRDIEHPSNINLRENGCNTNKANRDAIGISNGYNRSSLETSGLDDDIDPETVVKEENTTDIVAFSNEIKEHFYGGGTWQSYLAGSEKDASKSWSIPEDANAGNEIPLEVIVDKCIIQEILSQYQCISHLSVRLLFEFFGLQDHLAALRRYFFMERGDWADTFSAALYHHAWDPTGCQQRQIAVQTLLEAAIQNSSCENDSYAERLHVYIQTTSGQTNPESNAYDFEHVYVNKASLSAFDFIMLEYHVEWPINLVLTPKSFKIYNAIFSFLVRTKLAGHALRDLWHFMKALCRPSRKIDNEIRREWTKTLMLFRQQIAHFITTLQGYLESQLMHNLWSKFLGALHGEGKDLQDLEFAHTSYLQDSLHVCFLSDEMKHVKVHIDDIMQCLLDLSSCLYRVGKTDDGEPDIENANVQSVISEVKNRYELSIKHLHRIWYNSHNQLSLNHFWNRLDFNGFFEDPFGNL